MTAVPTVPRGASVGAIAGLFLLAAGACAPAGTPSNGEEGDPSFEAGAVEAEALLEAQRTGFEEPRRELIRDAETWRSVWSTAHQGTEPSPPVPPIDFSGQSVVLAAMGRRATGGYEVGVTEVRRTEGALAVTVREVSPGPGCIVTQALTSPAVAVWIPVAGAAAPEATFEVVEETRNCE